MAILLLLFNYITKNKKKKKLSKSLFPKRITTDDFSQQLFKLILYKIKINT